VNNIHINCSDFVAEMGHLLDEEVSPERRAHLLAHLAECKVCSVVYDSTRKTIRILTDSFELSAGEVKSSTEGIMARIRAMRSPHPETT
jgi:hypothetical protein